MLLFFVITHNMVIITGPSDWSKPAIDDHLQKRLSKSNITVNWPFAMHRNRKKTTTKQTSIATIEKITDKSETWKQL